MYIIANGTEFNRVTRIFYMLVLASIGALTIRSVSWKRSVENCRT